MSSDFSPTCGAACPRLGKRRVNFPKPWKKNGEIFQCLEKPRLNFSNPWKPRTEKTETEKRRSRLACLIFCPPLVSIFLSSVFLSTLYPRPARLAAGLQTALDQTVSFVVRPSGRSPLNTPILHHSSTPTLLFVLPLRSWPAAQIALSSRRHQPSAINHEPCFLNSSNNATRGT
jgi:hypothetical protein